MGIIYLLQNKINNKVYIGQTNRSLDTRLQEHKRYYKGKKSLITKAIMKYGWESFDILILANNVQSQEVLDNLEKQYISEYNSVQPNGYNIAGGAYGSNKPPTFSQTQENIIVSKYLNGDSSTKLAKEFGVTHHTIIACLKRNNVIVRKNIIDKQGTPITPEEYDAVVNKYNAGISINEIAQQYNCHKSTVCVVLAKMHVKRHNSKGKSYLRLSKDQFIALYYKYDQNITALAEYLGLTKYAIYYYINKYLGDKV